MNKTEIPEIMRPKFDVYHSENGIDYELRKVSLFKIVKICDYYYRDHSHDRREINLPQEANCFLMPVFFHHNDYWIVDGHYLAQAITQMSLIHRRDWRKVVNGKWRLQPDWWQEWNNKQE